MKVVLGLGSNLGDRALALKRAVVRLAHGPDPVLTGARLARVYASPALLPRGAPASWARPFLNTALAGETALGPRRLLERIQQVERVLGRRPAERWAPRPLDVDVLWWDGPPADHPDLVVPHPGLLERSFALEPLRDLVPDAVVAGATAEEHARRRRAEEEAPAVHDEEAELRVRHPLLMGILNLTPDSFSDGGLAHRPEDALARARALLDGGAAILDVGAESTRPDGAAVAPAEERRRLEPVLDAVGELRRGRSFVLSLDSRNPEVVAWGLERGVDWINDVTGLRDPAMREVAAGSDAELVAMHSLSVPVVRGETLPAHRDPVEVVLEWARDRMELLDAEGVALHRLRLDPGVGFGKSAEQSWRILDQVERLHAPGRPLLVGHSRKSFLGAVTGLPPEERDPATVEVSLQLARRGVEVLRVHAPEPHTRRFRAEEAARTEPWISVGGQSRSLTRPSSSE